MYSLCFGLPVQHVINEYMPKNMEHQEHHINVLHMGHVAILVLLKSITISLVLFTFRSRWFFSENTIKSSTINKTTNQYRAVRVGVVLEISGVLSAQKCLSLVLLVF